jgi:toxin secretion/phage lysis holin
LRGGEVVEYLKAAAAIIGAFVSWMVGGIGVAATVLLFLMAADYFTGILVAVFVTKDVNSRVGLYGLFRKVYIIILVGAVKLIEVAVLHSNGYIGDGVIAAYCVNEFISITENGGKLGAPMPTVVKNVIRVLKDKQDQEDQNKGA